MALNLLTLVMRSGGPCAIKTKQARNPAVASITFARPSIEFLFHAPEYSDQSSAGIGRPKPRPTSRAPKTPPETWRGTAASHGMRRAIRLQAGRKRGDSPLQSSAASESVRDEHSFARQICAAAATEPSKVRSE